MYDYLIVGAGFSGSVLAERLADAGKKVLLTDRRPHIGGNAYDHHDDHGILVHKYGPHIFHTNSERIYQYLSRFTRWRHYEHRVLAHVDGKHLPFPINADTISALQGRKMDEQEVEAFLQQVAVPITRARTFEEAMVSKIGRELFEKFILNYTRKQWGIEPSALDAAVAARVPARTNRDDRYFTDKFQVMPLHGFTRMFERMLSSRNITLLLQADYRDVAREVLFKNLIYTGPIDEYFGCCYGKLPYRSLRFEFKTENKPVFQPGPVVNFPNEHAYTRVTEFKYLTGQKHEKTSLVYEYPAAEGDPYYPIPQDANAQLYDRYKKLADEQRNVYFVGRLGTYRYYNMDQCVGQALAVFDRIRGARGGVDTVDAA
jgi:UDP-galactopyranose mutase